MTDKCQRVKYYEKGNFCCVWTLDIILPWLIGCLFPILWFALGDPCMPSPFYSSSGATDFSLYWSLLAILIAYGIFLLAKGSYHAAYICHCTVIDMERHREMQWPHKLAFGSFVCFYLSYADSLNTFLEYRNGYYVISSLGI